VTRAASSIDESIRRRIVAELQACPHEDVEAKADRLLAALQPVVGAAAQRRRNESSMKAAFKEGFLTGQKASRFSPWHSVIWVNSVLFRRMRDETRTPGSDEAALRFARYNDV
jgi:hypothetical protein